MGKAPQRLSRWTDDVLGELIWDEADLCWTTHVHFAGQQVLLQLDPDNRDPNHEEQLAAIEPSRALLEGLRVAESQLRRQAADQLAEYVAEFQAELNLPQVDFADTLEVEAISLHECGELHYLSPGWLPGWRVTVYFNEDLSFGEAEMSECDESQRQPKLSSEEYRSRAEKFAAKVGGGRDLAVFQFHDDSPELSRVLQQAEIWGSIGDLGIDSASVVVSNPSGDGRLILAYTWEWLETNDEQAIAADLIRKLRESEEGQVI